MYNGIVNVYKEQGFTSFDVVAKMRGIFGQKKIGHTGTLDPMAEGALIVCLGKATRLSEMITSFEKEYDATLRLGISTDTDDISGNILNEAEIQCTEDDVRHCIESFIGKQLQVPPIYSAIKKDGKKLYEYARRGIDIKPEAREIEIFDINIISIMLPRVKLHVRCSKGTYIRSICRDIGEKLGCFGTMEALLRTVNYGFKSEDGYRLSQLEEMKKEGRLGDVILPIDSLLENVPRADVIPGYEKLLINGNRLTGRMLKSGCDNAALEIADYIRVYLEDELAALYKYDSGIKAFRCFKYLGA